MGLSAGSSMNHGFNICKYFSVKSFHGLQRGCLDLQSTFDTAIIRSYAIFFMVAYHKGKGLLHVTGER